MSQVLKAVMLVVGALAMSVTMAGQATSKDCFSVSHLPALVEVRNTIRVGCYLTRWEEQAEHDAAHANEFDGVVVMHDAHVREFWRQIHSLAPVH